MRFWSFEFVNFVYVVFYFDIAKTTLFSLNSLFLFRNPPHALHFIDS